MKKLISSFVVGLCLTSALTWMIAEKKYKENANRMVYALYAKEAANVLDFHIELSEWFKQPDLDATNRLQAFNRTSIEMYLSKIELAKDAGLPSDFMSDEVKRAESALVSMPTMDELLEDRQKRNQDDSQKNNQVRIILPE